MDGGIASLLTEFAPEGILTILGGGALWRVMKWRSKVEARLEELQSIVDGISISLTDAQAAKAFRAMIRGRRGIKSDD